MSLRRLVSRYAPAALAATAFAVLAVSATTVSSVLAADKPEQITVDFATYNPVSLVLKDKGWLEKDLAKDDIDVRWVQSHGSNKALEFLKAGSIDFGSTAGAAALLGAINGNPIKAVYAYSRPEWTALVTQKDSPIRSAQDLKGKRIAVTRGTDPHIFLTRALADAGLSEKDVELVLLQHADGRRALEGGDVDAWAGLDPMMAQGELESGDRLFFRKPEYNTWGILNVREEFLNEHPDLAQRVLEAYERARKWSIDHPEELKKILAKAARIPEDVAARQLERTDLSQPLIGPAQRETIVGAGKALQEVGIIPADVNVEAATDDLFDATLTSRLASR